MNDAAVETAVLGSLLLANGECLDACRSIGLTPDDFEDPRNAKVYQAIEFTAEAGLGIDYLTVNETLRGRGEFEKAGGIIYLASLIDNVPAAMHGPHYARIVRERARKNSRTRWWPRPVGGHSIR